MDKKQVDGSPLTTRSVVKTIRVLLVSPIDEKAYFKTFQSSMEAVHKIQINLYKTDHEEYIQVCFNAITFYCIINPASKMSKNDTKYTTMKMINFHWLTVGI